MNSIRKIIIGFGIIIVLLAIMGIVAIVTTLKIAATSQQIYAHPFAVSNAARDISIHLLSIQRDMKNILLLEDQKQIQPFLDRINAHDKYINQDFAILFDRFLGNTADVQRLHSTFIEWELVRQEILSLINAGKMREARHITTTKSARYADSLTESTQQLIAFAAQKADQYNRDARRGERISIAVITSLLFIVMLISLAIVTYVVGTFRKDQKELSRHLYLVDQNVLICSLDKEGYVLDISNALCRLLGLTKEEILHKESDFFVDKNDTRLLERILRTLRTGKEWIGTFQRTDAQGNTLWLHSTIYPLLDQSYTISGYNIIIENITDKKAIEELSLRDGLTGLHNRRYYENNIEQIIKTARREEKYLTLAIFDIDFFKNYNDNYGHPAGDLVLFQVAKVLREQLNRPTDHCIRVGGEEFCVVFTGLDSQKSRTFLEQIRSGVQALQIEHEYSDAHSYVTISGGAVVSFGRDIPDKERLYSKADEALYKAKEERNKLVVT